MTSEAHPPGDNRLDERIDAYGLGYYHGIHADGGARSGESGAVPRCPFRLERPAPVERTSSGPGRRNAGRLRGRVAGRGRPRVDAVGGLRGHQRHPLTGAETRGAARRLSPLRPGPRSSRGSSPGWSPVCC